MQFPVSPLRLAAPVAAPGAPRNGPRNGSAADRRWTSRMGSQHLIVMAAKVRARAFSRASFGGGLLFAPPPPPRIKGHLHAVPEGTHHTLCGLDTSRWQIAPHYRWTVGLENACPECTRQNLELQAVESD